MNEEFEKDQQAEEKNEAPTGEIPAQEAPKEIPVAPQQTTEPVWQTILQEPPQEDPEFRKSGVVSMVLGIIAAALYACCGANIVLAIISLVQAGKNKRLSPNGRRNGMALAGTICSWCSIGFSILFWGIYALYFFIFFMLEMM